MPVEDEIDRLYALPPDEFTAARNELAKTLKADPDAAKRIRSLEKPNAVAWTLNRLARRSPHDIEAFLDVGDRLRSAERQAVGGGGSAALREAAEDERRAVGGLVADAERMAREEGTKVSPSFMQKLGDTLRAAVVDPAARESLVRGRLTRDLQRVGFIEPSVAPGAPARRPSPAKRPKTEAERRARDERRRARDEAESEAERLAADARRAAHDLERALRAERNAEREAERLARDAADATRRARDAKQRLAAAKRAAREAQRDADRAAKSADDAAGRVPPA